jgi:hypothetical protein
MAESKNVLGLLKDIEPDMQDVARADICRDGMYRITVRGAVVKAYQYARYSHSRQPEDKDLDEASFFSCASLRGICEDLIALKYFGKLKRAERDEIVHTQMMVTTFEEIEKQTRFFARIRPYQPVLPPSSPVGTLPALKKRMHEIGASAGLWKTNERFPSINAMAKAVDLHELYDYLYSVTSQMVHFSPKMIMRSVWGDVSSGKVSASFGNFARYYSEVQAVYSVYLFWLQCKTFQQELSLTPTIIVGADALYEVIDGELRWPEAVTYEEMNIEPPSDILRVLLKCADHVKTSRQGKDSEMIM